ncbi:hypothetical protein ACI65C_000577 [Semiaphis heraclei]
MKTTTKRVCRSHCCLYSVHTVHSRPLPANIVSPDMEVPLGDHGCGMLRFFHNLIATAAGAPVKVVTSQTDGSTLRELCFCCFFSNHQVFLYELYYGSGL